MNTDKKILLDRVFNEANQYYLRIKTVYKESGYEKKYPLGVHWIANMRGLIELIQAEKDPVKKIGTIHETVMYSINTADEVIRQKMVAWYITYFQNQGIHLEDFSDHICESPYSNSKNSSQWQGRLVSPDFLRTVILCLEMKKYCQFPHERFRVLELGAGYGGLARTFKLFFPNTCTVITDIPETLYFSYLFLRLNFPDGKFCYVSDPSDLKKPLEDYDLVFVPTMFANVLEGKQFTLFYNTASLGEMRNEVIRYWMDFVQNKIAVKYFFGLNRYLNVIDPACQKDRLNENCCSVLFDAHWKILQWELDPGFARCPYFETLVSRNLEIIAERLTHPCRRTQSENEKVSNEILNEISSQDWFTHPVVRNYRIVMEASQWPLTNTRADNLMTPDLTMGGTLFALWESIRLKPSAGNVEMMLQYLDVLEGKRPFEERYYYEDLWESLTNRKYMSLEQASNKTPGIRKFLGQMKRAVLDQFRKY